MDKKAETFTYRFGEWLVEPHLNRIRRGEEEVRLEPRTLDVLRHLLDRHGEIVSTQELLESVWKRQIVEPNAVHHHITRIRRAIGDNPRDPTHIETISKRGYRAIATVDKALLKAVRSDEGGATDVKADWPKHRQGTTEIGLVPFTDLLQSAEPSVADRVFRSVVAKVSTTAWKSAVVGSDGGGARYVLNGSAHESDGSVCIDVSLSNSRNETVWAQSYTYARADAEGRAHARVAEKITIMIGWILVNRVAEKALDKPVSERAAADYVALALSEGAGPHAREFDSRKKLATQAEYLERALKLDDNFAAALNLRGVTLLEEVYFGMATSVEDNVRRAAELTAKAVRIADRTWYHHVNHARAMWCAGKHEQAIIGLSRFSSTYDGAVVLFHLCLIQLSGLHVEAAERTLSRAMELGLEPASTATLSGMLAFACEDYGKASDELIWSLEHSPNDHSTGLETGAGSVYLFATAALVLAGREPEAVEAFGRYRAAFPDESTGVVMRLFRTLYPSFIDAMQRSLAIAGWDEIS